MPTDQAPGAEQQSSSPTPPTPPSLSQRIWRRFCRLQVRAFYRQFEVEGLDHLPSDGPLILCANHVNALVDALVVQAACPRPIHPIARSGLFRNPLLRPILAFIQAVPIYRRPKTDDPAADRKVGNEDSFRRCFEILAEGGVILIFPEGQSHSDPSLRPLKTGAARLALGHRERTGETVPVVPVGLTFSHKGRFRAGVLVEVGRPVDEPAQEETASQSDPDPADLPLEEIHVRRYTDAINQGLEKVTLNVDSWEDLALMRLLQQFFALRLTLRTEDGRDESLADKRPTLARRFRSFKRLIEAQRALRAVWPDKVDVLREKLRRFDELCRRYGVRDYQLELAYTPGVIALWWLRTIAFGLFVVPLALWGFLHSALPYFLTRAASRISARGRDQYDTAGMLWGLIFFLAFWGAQTAFVSLRWGLWPAVGYGVSLPFVALLALKLGWERRRLLEEARVFLLFLRRRELQRFLRLKREELEIEVGRLARLARQAQEQLADAS